MLVSQQPFPHRQGLLVEGFGLPIAPLIVVEQSQIVEATGHIGMLVSQQPFPHRQGLLITVFRFLVATSKPADVTK